MTDPDNTPMYPDASDRQCLKLSEKLYAARMEIMELQEENQNLLDQLNELQEQCTQ